MNAPPSYQELVKMLEIKTEIEKMLTDKLAKSRANESELIQQLKSVSESTKVFQQAYLRISTHNSILEEKIRRLEGRM
jgi:hypothetical protein